MIARLKGEIAGLGADWLVIDVGGVGYLVQASARTLAALAIGAAAALHVETQVREDAITLFGFVTEAELAAFRLLVTVPGVGGRVALNILAVLPPDSLARAIASADTASIARANGVGPKLAARIANELKAKMGGIALGPAAGPALPPGNRLAHDARAALAALGFRPIDAARAVAEALAELGEDAALNDVVRAALKRSARA